MLYEPAEVFFDLNWNFIKKLRWKGNLDVDDDLFRTQFIYKFNEFGFGNLVVYHQFITRLSIVNILIFVDLKKLNANNLRIFFQHHIFMLLFFTIFRLSSSLFLDWFGLIDILGVWNQFESTWGIFLFFNDSLTIAKKRR